MNVIDAVVDGDVIRYEAELSDGNRVSGIITKDIGPYTTLSDEALEQLAEEIQ